MACETDASSRHAPAKGVLREFIKNRGLCERWFLTCIPCAISPQDAAKNAGVIETIDVNPFLALPNGAIALDALIVPKKVVKP